MLCLDAGAQEERRRAGLPALPRASFSSLPHGLNTAGSSVALCFKVFLPSFGINKA